MLLASSLQDFCVVGEGIALPTNKQQCRAALAVADGAAGRYDGACASSPTYPDNPMNRQKKIKQLLKAHAKKASAKLAPRKPKYICKADRAKLAAEAGALADASAES